MGKHFCLTLLAGLTVALLTACSGNGDAGPVKMGESSGVYITGSAFDMANASTSGFELGRLWVNGVPSTFRGGRLRTTPASVSVSSGGDVYVAGVELDFLPCAVLWKNGARTQLGDAQSYAWSVFTAGEDVYVAGSQQYSLKEGAYEYTTVARLWKNGQAMDLSDKVAQHSETAHSVFVSGDDVYVAGIEGDPDSGSTHAKLWKNGEGAVLDNGGKATFAWSVCVHGDDVYVAGYEETTVHGRNKALLWKNGGRIDLNDNNGYSEARSVVVSDEGDVYVAGHVRVRDGNEVPRAAVWKNGELRVLGPASFANSVFVSDGVAYVAGTALDSGRNVAMLWEDGVGRALVDVHGQPASESSGATSVFVKK